MKSTGWQSIGDITPAKGVRMKMTSDNFYKIIAMHEEIIFQQKDEIAKLKSTVNKLRLKLNKD